MAANWKDYQQKYDELPVRMRLLLFAAIAMIALLLMDLIWLSPGMNSIKQKQQQIVKLDSEIGQLTADLQLQNAATYAQQNSAEQKEIKKLDADIKALKSSLEESTVNLVNANEMVALLKTIVGSFDNLKIIRLEKRPAEAVAFDAESKNMDNSTIQLYRHTLKLELSGDYDATGKFLKAIEELPRKMQFDHFDYQVKQYPKAEVVLELSTLSFDKEWIGG